MAWFRRTNKPITGRERRKVTRDVFEKCPECREILYLAGLRENLRVCPECGHHMPFPFEGYISLLLDEGSFRELDTDLRSDDPLQFTDSKAYVDRVRVAEAKGANEALTSGRGRMDGMNVVLTVMNFKFIGGSMGSVVGEKLARAGRTALEEEEPLIAVSASGGARMQEGIYSLMQMAKTSAVLGRLHERGIPFISVLTHPTTGGVTASFAMLGDANLAEPGALVGFAGPRVIEATIRESLPKGFQRAQFLLDHGMIDAVVTRCAMKDTIVRLLRHQFNGWG
ncbi:MAG: acetyl-CoA carboxylase carboxyltransferase subunit beta [Gemmatimonadetes bacterium]|nr:acetyl-CoA carboxylase carboxyltransferase subunit beta [Gemmatimonadota bacterium]